MAAAAWQPTDPWGDAVAQMVCQDSGSYAVSEPRLNNRLSDGRFDTAQIAHAVPSAGLLDDAAMKIEDLGQR